MDNTLLKQRVKIVLHLLSCEEPKYKGRDFMSQLVAFTKECLNRTNGPWRATDTTASNVIAGEAQRLVLELEKKSRWPELMGGWYPEDIYNELLNRIRNTTPECKTKVI